MISKPNSHDGGAVRQTKFWGVMPAAGIGARMGLDFPKQYLRINDKAIIEYSIELLLEHSSVEQLVVCVSADDAYYNKLGLDSSRVSSVIGGATRADSVLNGLLALAQVADERDWVLVHDAARPCLRPELLQGLIAAVETDDIGGILAVKAKDTLKLAETDGLVARSNKTIDRASIWQAQTPQMFRYGLLVEALRYCREQGLSVTDEASALEQKGHSVKLVDGSATNIKVTSPEDQRLAEFFLLNDN